MWYIKTISLLIIINFLSSAIRPTPVTLQYYMDNRCHFLQCERKQTTSPIKHFMLMKPIKPPLSRVAALRIGAVHLCVRCNCVRLSIGNGIAIIPAFQITNFFFVFLMQFRLRRATPFVSSPAHLCALLFPAYTGLTHKRAQRALRKLSSIDRMT